MKLRSALIAALTCSFLLAACTGESSTDEAEEAAPLTPTLVDVSSPTSVVDGASPTHIALATSQAFFSQAPVVVVADAGDAAAQEQATTLAGDVGAPVLLAAGPASEPAPSGTASPAATTPAAESTAVADGLVSQVVGEIERLGATTVVTYGTGAVGVTDALGDGVSSIAAPAGAAPSDVELPATEPATPSASVLALATPASGVAAEATARAAGAEVRRVAGPDPRTDRDLIQALASSKPARVVALGSEFGPPDQLAARVSVAATGVELPGGGQVLYPYRRHIALYGNPTTGALGSLGEQPLPEAITRVKRLAAEYQQLTDTTVVPTFEIITTVASAVPDDDGNYSTESALSDIRPYIDAAAKAGVYVVLDLQPGRTDFLTQAQLYEQFLKQPHVGLALDPEWRLGSEPGPPSSDRYRHRRRDQQRRHLARRPDACQQPAAEAASPAPVQVHDDQRSHHRRHQSGRARGADSRRWIRPARSQVRDLERAARGSAAECLVGLEELHRRGLTDVHASPDAGDRSRAVLR